MSIHNDSRILITGANGFLGKHVVKAFNEYREGGTSGSRRNIEILTPSKQTLNLLDKNSVENYIWEYQPDIVIHLAGTVGGIGLNKNEPGRLTYENLIMGVNLIEACRHIKLDKFVCIGTTCSYAANCPIPFKEEDFIEFNQSGPGMPEITNAGYGIMKRTLYELLRNYNLQYNFPFIYLIPVNMSGECFSKDTVIATPFGFKNIADFNIGDKIYTLNPDTHEVEIEKVIATQKQTTDTFVHFNGSIIDLKVTPNHQIYYKTNKNKFIKRKAEWFMKRAGKKYGQIGFASNLPLAINQSGLSTIFSLKDYIDKNHEIKNNQVRDYKHSHSHWINIEYNIEDVYEFLGWYISEGSSNNNDNNQISISQKKSIKHRESIRQLLSRMKIPFGEDADRFYFSSRLWNNFLKKEVGVYAQNKHIPFKLLNAPQKLLNILFQALMDGDGDYDNSRYTTTSTLLKDQIILLAMLNGIQIGKVYLEKRKHNNESDIWRIPFRKKRKNSVKYKNINIENLSQIEDVYCITTEKNHIIYAGRNNKFCWVGQCDNFNDDSSHVIPAMLKKFHIAKMNGDKTVTLWGDGSASREFLYAGDAAEAILRATLLYHDTMPINLGSGQEVTIYDLAYKIKNLVGFNGDIIWDSTKPNGQLRRCLDVTKAKENFGFVAETSLDKMLEKTYQWAKENGVL